MHFFVHSAWSALAPLTPHLESLTQPFTVWASLANDAEATIKIRAPASNNKRNFRMQSSFRFVPTHIAISNSITGGAEGGLRTILSTSAYLSFLARPVGGVCGGSGATYTTSPGRVQCSCSRASFSMAAGSDFSDLI